MAFSFLLFALVRLAVLQLHIIPTGKPSSGTDFRTPGPGMGENGRGWGGGLFCQKQIPFWGTGLLSIHLIKGFGSITPNDRALHPATTRLGKHSRIDCGESVEGVSTGIAPGHCPATAEAPLLSRLPARSVSGSCLRGRVLCATP